jgi:uncharacterized protein (DUF58 family)
MGTLLSSLRFEREAWIRFILAIVGLILAFGAALFSTVTRQAGNVVATAIFASLALLLAGFVGLTTVPYLARRVAFERVRDVFDYDVTKEGLVYLGIIIVIGIAALNTGNNLLFIVVSAMLAAILVSGITSAGELRGLELKVGLPEHTFAGEAVLARITLRNTRRWLPAISINVVPPKRQKAGRRLRWQRDVFVWPPKAPPGKQWIRLPDITLTVVTALPPERSIFTGRVYFPYIPARLVVTRPVELRFERRGRYVQDAFGLSTRFPFSFLAKTRRVTLPVETRVPRSSPVLARAGKLSSGNDHVREVVVYPSVQPTADVLEILPMITGEFEVHVRGRGNDLYRIREYLPEDSARHVHWKASARTGSLKVREFTREDERKLRLVFDNPSANAVSASDYERGVTTAASLAWHFAGENTELTFAAPGYEGTSDIYDFLRYLALVAPRPAEDSDKSILDELHLSDDYNVILTARPRGSIPTSLWSRSYFVFFGEPK